MGKILHVNHRYWPVVGGSEQSVAAIATRQAAAGHQVTVLVTDALDFAAFWDPQARRIKERSEQEQGVTIKRTPIKYYPGKLWSFAALRRAQTYLGWWPLAASYLGRYVPYLPRLTGNLAELGEDWDLVVGWNITFDGLMAGARQTAKNSDAPFLAVPFLHLGESPRSPVRRTYTMPHQMDLLRTANHVLVQTEVAATFLKKAGIGAERVSVLGLGIDLESLAGGDAERFLARTGASIPVVTAIGPLTRDKGTQTLVEAAKIVLARGRALTLALAGPAMEDFERYWQDLPKHVKDHVLRLDTVVGEEKKDLLAASSLLALPSRTDSFGIVLLEAWLYAKPVIGADAGGIPGLISDGEDGRVVPYGDADALAMAIIEILDDPLKAQAWGQSGQQKVRERYTWDKVYERFRAVAGIG
ncbi:MAG: glycosyltransferase family 4 protein [Candidatus Promineifilaceae bacterium]